MSLRMNYLTGLLLGAGGATLFSLKGVLMKLAYGEGASVELMMALRMGIALPFYLAIGALAFHRLGGRARFADKTFRHTVFIGAVLGVAGYYLCAWLDFTGLQYISAQLERLILFLYPTIVAVIARIFFGDRLTWRHGAALFLSYSGVALLAWREFESLGPNAALGAILVFLAAILFAIYIAASKPLIATLGADFFTSLAMSAASVGILLHATMAAMVMGDAFYAGDQIGQAWFENPRLWLLGVVLALPCTIAPSFMIANAIARIGPGLTSAVAGVGPAGTVIFAVWLLGEPFGVTQALALLLTVLGVVFLAGVKKPPKEQILPAE